MGGVRGNLGRAGRFAVEVVRMPRQKRTTDEGTAKVYDAVPSKEFAQHIETDRRHQELMQRYLRWLLVLLAVVSLGTLTNSVLALVLIL